MLCGSETRAAWFEIGPDRGDELTQRNCFETNGLRISRPLLDRLVIARERNGQASWCNRWNDRNPPCECGGDGGIKHDWSNGQNAWYAHRFQ
jgi:hypothetical protein